MANNLLVVIFIIVLSMYIPFGSLAQNEEEAERGKKQTGKITSRAQSDILLGVEAGRGLAEALTNGDFSESLKKIATNLYGFLGVAGPMAGIALSFIPTGDSVEMTFMKEQFQEVNRKLEEVIAEFTEVKEAIDWSAVTVSYGVYERKIRAADANLLRFYDNVGSARRNEQENFIIQYESDFENSLQKLYDAIVNDDHLFSTNILDAVEIQTKKHKRKLEQFSLGLIQLLVQGIKVKISYYAMKNWTSEHLVDEWDVKMITLKTKLQKRSDEIKDAWLTQFREDASEIIVSSEELSHEDLMHKLNRFLKDKYDWRYFFVAVYDDVYGEYKHNMVLCGGLGFLHLGGRNTVIASEDKKFKATSQEHKQRSQLVQYIGKGASNCMPDTGRHPDAKALVQTAVSREQEECSPYRAYLAVPLDSGFRSVTLPGHSSGVEIKASMMCCYPWQPRTEPCKMKFWNHKFTIFS